MLFTGTARHQDGERPVSVVDGWIRLDTRRLLTSFDGDLHLDSLSFEGIRAGYPTLPSLGSITGQVRLAGTMERMELDADVHGEIGALRVRGPAVVMPPRWGGDSLQIDFRNLDLRALRGGGPTSDLTGGVFVVGSIDTLRAPEGSITGALGPGRLDAFRLDTAEARISVRDSVVTVDTIGADWRGGMLGGRGTLGWAHPHEGQMELIARFDSLHAFDSLLVARLELGPDSAGTELQGQGRLDLSLAGSLDSLVVSGFADASQLKFRGARLNSLSATFGWVGGSRPQLSLQMLADTIASGPLAATNVRVGSRGWSDSLEWSGSFESGDGAAFGAIGRFDTEGATRRFAIDSLSMALSGHLWRLLAPAVAETTDSGTVLSPLRLESVDGSGAVTVAGTLPGKRRGASASTRTAWTCATWPASCAATPPACPATSARTSKFPAPVRRPSSRARSRWATPSSATSAPPSSRASCTTRTGCSRGTSPSGRPGSASSASRWRCRWTWRSPRCRAGRSRGRWRSARGPTASTSGPSRPSRRACGGCRGC